MTQLTLYDPCARKHGGPETSVEAFAKVDTANDCDRVYQEILRAGSYGLTLHEACAVMNRLPHQISGRFTTLNHELHKIETRGRRTFNWHVGSVYVAVGT